MVFPRQIPRLPKWALLTIALVLLAGTAQTVYALSCIGAYNERLILEIERVEIDGVSQEDLSSYEALHIELMTYNSTDELRLVAAEGDSYSEIYVSRSETLHE